MIRITQQASAAGAKRYYATADYYSEGQEIVGAWGGKGAERLGLSGTVDKDSFERLCDNLDPRTGEQLTVRNRSERTVGYDFTFSVPKSVSLLYAMSGDQGIMESFRGAVNETMVEIESEMKTRVRRGLQDTNRTTGNLTWAEFIHTTSRPVDGLPDPQLHAHVFVFNNTWDSVEDRWKAGQFREIKRDAPYFQAAFRVRLANRLQDIGFGVQRKRDDFELTGIPADILKRYSRRTAVIERMAEEKGITDPDRKAELGAETREKKSKEMGWNALKKEWDSRLSNDERELLATVHRRETPVNRIENGERHAVDHAIDHSFVREAVVAERKVLTEALKRGLGTITVDKAAHELKDRPLIRSEMEGRAMATTKEMLALEKKLVEFAKDGRGRSRPLGNPKRPFSRQWLNDGQKAAIKHVMGSRDRVMMIRGAAGTGKTTLEQELGEALAEAGKSVVALAQSAGASRDVLRNDAGFANADTVARFLVDHDMQQAAKNGVILVDEASLLGTRDMQRIFEIAESVRARVVLVGDRKQHRSVLAGEPLKLLEQRAGLPVAEVTDILRQQGDYKQIAKLLSESEVEQAFDQLKNLGWIHEVADEDRNAKIAAAYVSAASEQRKDGALKSVLVVSPTHAEGSAISAAIRDELKIQGRLKDERMVTSWVSARLTEAQRTDPTEYSPGDLIQFQQNAKGFKKGSRVIVTDGLAPPVEQANRFELYRNHQIALAAGDRIRITAGGKTKDGKHRLSTGAILNVRGFTSRGDIVVDHGWVIDRDFGHITHGYAVTSHTSQGKTVNKVIVAISSESIPATDRRTAYVAITRGKEEALVFTDNANELLKAVQRNDTSISAIELADILKPEVRKPSPQRLRLQNIRELFASRNELPVPTITQENPGQELDHDR